MIVPDAYSFLREGGDYTLNGQKVDLSVTRAIRLAGVCRWHATREDMSFYLKRGRDVHMICADADWKRPDYWHDGPLVNYVQGWLAFCEDAGFVCEPEHIEQKVFHSIHKYAGTLDRKGKLRSRQRRAVAEIKTGSPEPWHSEQLAGYWLTLPEEERKITDRIAVYLADTGRYTLVRFDNHLEAREAFLAELTVARTRIKRGLASEEDGGLFDEILHEVITEFRFNDGEIVK